MTRKPAQRSYHHGSLKEALVGAAQALLAEEGVQALTLRACARRAGVSHAAPQHHFATREDLLAEVAARGFEEFHARLEEAKARSADRSPAGAVIAMGLGYLAFAADRPAIYAVMFGRRMQADASPHLLAAARAAWTQLRDAAARLAGEARGDVAAMQIWSQVHGLAALRVTAGNLGAIISEDSARTMLGDLCAGLSHGAAPR